MPVTERSRACVRVFAVRLIFRNVLRLLLPLALFSSGTALCAQTIGIKLVNGRNGRPIAASCVNVGVGVGNERKKTIAIPTDKDGIARLRLTDNDDEIDIRDRWKDCGLFGVIKPVVKYDDVLAINVGYVLCQSRTADNSWLAITDLSTKEVFQHGIVTANTCGKATASPKPGEVIIFVRPLTWWEKLKQ
jgi:hypothetical protein